MISQHLQASFEKLRSIDSSLTEEEFNTFNPNSALIDSWQMNYSDDWFIVKLGELRAETHRRNHLERYDASSWNAGRCYIKGTEKWRRKDGKPMTEADKDSLEFISYGQSVSVKGSPGDEFLTVDWSRDSGD